MLSGSCVSGTILCVLQTSIPPTLRPSPQRKHSYYCPIWWMMKLMRILSTRVQSWHDPRWPPGRGVSQEREGQGCRRKGVWCQLKSEENVGCEWGSRNMVILWGIRDLPEGRKEGSSCAIQENNSGSKPAGRKARIYQEPVNFCEGSDSNYFRLCEPSGSVSTTYFHGGIKATVNSDDWTNVLVFQENFIYRNRRHPGLGHCAVVCQPLVFQ